MASVRRKPDGALPVDQEPSGLHRTLANTARKIGVRHFGIGRSTSRQNHPRPILNFRTLDRSENDSRRSIGRQNVPECGSAGAREAFILQENSVKQGFTSPGPLDSD